jgi:hypothetical protein
MKKIAATISEIASKALKSKTKAMPSATGVKAMLLIEAAQEFTLLLTVSKLFLNVATSKKLTTNSKHTIGIKRWFRS